MGDVRLGPVLARADKDVIVGADLGQPVVDQPAGLGRTEGHVGGIPRGQHRHAQVHRLDHAKAPALGAVQRDIGIRPRLEPQHLVVGQGRVQKGDARIARQRRVHRLPHAGLRGVGHPRPVLGLDQQPHRRGLGRVPGKGPFEGGQNALRVLAPQKGETVETDQEGEVFRPGPGPGAQERAGRVARDLGQGLKAHADLVDRAGAMRGETLDAEGRGHPEFIDHLQAQEMAGGGAVQFPEGIGDIGAARKHVRQVGGGQRQRLDVEMPEVDAGRTPGGAGLAGCPRRGVVEREFHPVYGKARLVQHPRRQPGGLAQPRGTGKGADHLHLGLGSRFGGGCGGRVAGKLGPVALGGAAGKGQAVQVEPRPGQRPGIARRGDVRPAHVPADPRQRAALQRGGAGRLGDVAQQVGARERQHHHGAGQRAAPLRAPGVQRRQLRHLGAKAQHEGRQRPVARPLLRGQGRERGQDRVRHQAVLAAHPGGAVGGPPIGQRRALQPRHLVAKGADRARGGIPVAGRIEPGNRLRRERNPQPGAGAAVIVEVMAQERQQIAGPAGRVEAAFQPVAQAQELGIGKERPGQGAAFAILGRKEPRLHRRCRARGQVRGGPRLPERQPLQVAVEPAGQGRAVLGQGYDGPGGDGLGGGAVRAFGAPMAQQAAPRADHPQLAPAAIGAQQGADLGGQGQGEPGAPVAGQLADPLRGQVAAIDMGGGLRQQRAADVKPDPGRPAPCQERPAHQRATDLAIQVAAEPAPTCHRPAQPAAQGVRQAHRSRISPSSRPAVPR